LAIEIAARMETEVSNRNRKLDSWIYHLQFHSSSISQEKKIHKQIKQTVIPIKLKASQSMAGML
jgi:hypothetical protein